MLQATFDDGLEEEAINKRHSMTCEAVEIGQKAKAYRTLLTHFSQRYPKIPVIDPSFQKSTCIAFDLMTVNLAGECTILAWIAVQMRLLGVKSSHRPYSSCENASLHAFCYVNGRPNQQVECKVEQSSRQAVSKSSISYAGNANIFYHGTN